MRKKPIIYYIVDRKGWVQHKRFDYLQRYQQKYRLKLLSARRFFFYWSMGLMKEEKLFFSTWRIIHGRIKKNPHCFQTTDFKNIMVGVTSHSNIGGGLDPLNPIPGRTPDEALILSTNLLKKNKVVTVNSNILYRLLKSELQGLMYCPNGVDCSFFKPQRIKKYDPQLIRIGWVGKIRAAKNYDVICAVKHAMETRGFEIKMIDVSKKKKRAPFSQAQMKDYYNNIDYYLCASWNEGTPNPALEAAACGIPIITTMVGNMPDLITKKNGFFIEPTIESIIQTLEDLKKLSVTEYEEFSRTIRSEIKKNWGWDSQINYFVKAFDQLYA